MDNIQKVSASLRAPASLVVRSCEPEADSSYRTDFMRDRDRILYSKAFRRLSGKTQVYVTGSDDHIRTRLTHTLEVSQIARTIAQTLNLDTDLTEAISLGHDIGHTPFGHAGERMLHQLMTENLISATGESIVIPTEDRGFKHNLQGVATSILAEKNYESDGLALTNFTLWGIKAHSGIYYANETENNVGYYSQFNKHLQLKDCESPAISFEAYVVREADEIAQRHHDLEDAIRGNLITNADIIGRIRDTFSAFLPETDQARLERMSTLTDSQEFLAHLAKLIVNLYVTRLLESSSKNINWLIKEKRLSEDSFPEFIKHPDLDTAHTLDKIISYTAFDESLDDKFSDAANRFKAFISERVLASYDIQKADAKGQYIIRKLFRAFVTSPSQLPDHCVLEFLKNDKGRNWDEIRKKQGMGEIRIAFLNRVKLPRNIQDELNLKRVVCNYIAGMTDNYAKQIFSEIYK